MDTINIIGSPAPGLPSLAFVLDGKTTVGNLATTLAAGAHSLNTLGIAATYKWLGQITLATNATLTVNDHQFAKNPVILSGQLTFSDKSWFHAGPTVYSGMSGISQLTGVRDPKYSAAGTVTQTGPMSISGACYMSSSGGTVLVVSGEITGSGQLILTASPGAPPSGAYGAISYSRIRLEGNNSYTGGTLIRQSAGGWMGGESDANQVWAASLGTGNVTLGWNGWGGQGFLTALGANITAPTAIISFGSAGNNAHFSSFDLAGYNQSLGGLMSIGTDSLGKFNCLVRSTTGSPVLTLNSAIGQTCTYFGKITNAIALIKNGSGTQVLSGASTYTGGTTINAGTLTVGHLSALGVGPVVVNAGATLNRGGFAIANAITNNGGVVI